MAIVGTLRLQTDTPASNAIVTMPFQVGGWALDQSAPSGTGTALGRLLPPAREANDLQRRILVASGKAISMKKSGEIYLYDEAYK